MQKKEELLDQSDRASPKPYVGGATVCSIVDVMVTSSAKALELTTEGIHTFPLARWWRGGSMLVYLLVHILGTLSVFVRRTVLIFVRSSSVHRMLIFRGGFFAGAFVFEKPRAPCEGEAQRMV